MNLFSVRSGYFVIALSSSLLCPFVLAAGIPSCEQEIQETNAALVANGAAPVANVGELATTLRALSSTGRLPAKYITSEEAKTLGWTGKDDTTLWGLKPTNGKMIGGDNYSDTSLPPNYQWFSADVDVSRGYRSNVRLVYSLQSPLRFISPDKYQHLMELNPCQ
ncbi:ribonuclease domain-containing protein [Yokenella regensburgei]|jgi:hypothetical protein|uniref:ribonuclease domain-containing protein n=1 Tax=Yokenella regensburgei TaxID=158877 RepID=UPI0002421759|nr:ribonuclease domain-containing protein [Yokenella regensburgei]EHM51744.1 ribonuclease [Yokenella regensburgei ATCC 43003]